MSGVLEWMERALCRPENGLLQQWWFPERGASAWHGKRVCFQCPVRLDCENYAFDNGIRHGIYGGFSERERRVMRRTRPPKPVVMWCRRCRRKFETTVQKSRTIEFCDACEKNARQNAYMARKRHAS